MTIKPQTSTPIPKPSRAPARRKYPFDTIRAGEMFFVPDRHVNTLAKHASTTGIKLGMRFTTRLCWMRKTSDGWVSCDATHARAVQGIGVWCDGPRVKRKSKK